MDRIEKLVYDTIKENGGKITRHELTKILDLGQDEIDDSIYNLEQQGYLILGRGSQIYDSEDQVDVWMEASIRE